MEPQRGPDRVMIGLVPLVALVLGILPGSLLAQQTGVVTGRVRDATSLEPLPAAQVFIPGTAIAVLTDGAGGYRLESIPPGSVEVQVQGIGYATGSRIVQVQAGATVIADFNLSISAVSLDELVVTVTGLQRRRELGNAVATIRGAEELEKAAPVTLTDLLQGRATGVQVLQSSGTVGGSATIKIRGNSSINLDNTPLIYIDGARISNDVESGPGVGGQTTSRLNDLNLYDIESIEIVKGPSAATLYGTEAAAGVIRITTKRGRAGLSEWTFRSQVGGSWNVARFPATVWNPRSFWGETLDVSNLYAPGELPEGVYFASIPDTLYSLNLLQDGIAGEDVYGTPWRTGLELVNGISLQGGTDDLGYFVSAELGRREGILPNNESTQRSVRANLNLTPSPRVNLLVSTGFVSNQILLPNNDNNAFGYMGVGMLAHPWEMAIRRSNPAGGGEFITCPYTFEIQRALTQAGLASSLSDFDCAENPFFAERTFEDVATLVNSQKIERFTGSATLNYRPLRFLAASATVGYDQFSDQTGSFVPVDERVPFGDLSRGARSISHVVVRNLTMDGNLIATFDLTSNLRSTTSVGGQFFRDQGDLAASSGEFLPPGASTVSRAVRTRGFETTGEGRTIGLFVEQQLAWRDRFFLTPAVRFDESSTFGEAEGRTSYPRVAASWVVSEEGWFADRVPGSLVESLRLRGAWGESGKQPSAFAAVPIFGSRRVTFREEDVSGIFLTRPGNPDLRPEIGQELEMGFDAALLEGRLGLDFTWFRKVTRNAIVARPLAPSSGHAGAITANIGELQHHGLELGVSAVAWSSPRLNWDWQINLSTNQGEITELEEPIVFGLGGDSQRMQRGYPYASYFSKTFTVNGQGDVVASDSAVFVGQPTPKLEGSISTSVRLLGWMTLSAQLGFAAGHHQFNSTEQFRCGFIQGGLYGGVCPELYEKGPDGQRSDRARVKAAAADEDQYAPWIEDAGFARLRTASARFEIPLRWVARVGATRASFTVTGENLALFTGYSGLDPEVNFAGGSQSRRAEFLTLPPARRVIGRLAITF